MTLIKYSVCTLIKSNFDYLVAFDKCYERFTIVFMDKFILINVPYLN